MADNKGVKPAADKPVGAEQAKSSRAVLIMAALDMSWRLAIAVLVPIIAGFELDQHFDIAPALTIVGFVIAMVGTFFIMKRTLDMANSKYKTGVKR